MTHVIQTLHLLVTALAGWLNRHQQMYAGGFHPSKRSHGEIRRKLRQSPKYVVYYPVGYSPCNTVSLHVYTLPCNSNENKLFHISLGYNIDTKIGSA